MLHTELAIFAARFSIEPAEAYVLPTVFERAAQMVGLPIRSLLSQATYSNQPLGEYIASVARKVAQEDTAAL